MNQNSLFSNIRNAIGYLHREVKVAVTPVPRPKKWVFLVGCYNSGTTLLAELLGNHEEVSALPTEGHFITDQFVKDYEIGIPRMWVDKEEVFRLTENDKGPNVKRIKKEWGMRLDCTKPVLLEKSPPNSARTRWFQKHFENAHFIGIVRNGYAVAEGISRKGNPKHLKNGWPIEKSAYQWKRSNEILLSDSKHLEKFLLIKYEDLTEEPKKVLNQITSFLDIPEFNGFICDQSFSIHERNDPIKNMNSESIARLSTEDISSINNIAGDMLRYFGYPIIESNK